MIAQGKSTSIIPHALNINVDILKAWEVLEPDFADIQIWAFSVKHSSPDDTQSFNGSLCTA